MVRERLRETFATGDDPYANADLTAATRLSGAMSLVAALFALVTLPLAPPSGPLGWEGAIGFIAYTLLLGAAMLHKRKPTKPVVLLAGVYGSLGMAVLYRASAGPSAPFDQLLFIIAIYAATTHPVRRTLVVLFCASAAAATPVWYEDVQRTFWARTVCQTLLICCVGLIVCGWMTRVRRQRGLDKEAARVDTLTGLLNRRALEEGLPIAVSFTRRHHQPLSLLVADMDEFKGINDTFGHGAGDDMLRSAARSMNAALRLSDPCFRWGGDEFVAILPDADLSEAIEIADRVRATVAEACRTPDGHPLRITVGAAELGPGDSGESALERADAELLARKAARRAPDRAAA
ncbi:MAG: hypothetical protein QOF76_3288 [Solirubrobacteraceae bacterium]|nr:hypothetical protein [Solirubrobacteraceae bacterium]